MQIYFQAPKQSAPCQQNLPLGRAGLNSNDHSGQSPTDNCFVLYQKLRPASRNMVQQHESKSHNHLFQVICDVPYNVTYFHFEGCCPNPNSTTTQLNSTQQNKRWVRHKKNFIPPTNPSTTHYTNFKGRFLGSTTTATTKATFHLLLTQFWPRPGSTLDQATWTYLDRALDYELYLYYKLII